MLLGRPRESVNSCGRSAAPVCVLIDVLMAVVQSI